MKRKEMMITAAVALAVVAAPGLVWAGCGGCGGLGDGEAAIEKKAAGCSAALGCPAGAPKKAAACSGLGCAAGRPCAKCKSHGAQTKEESILTTAALKALIDANVPIKLFDARSGKYDDGRRIPGASSLSAAANENEIAKAIGAKDALVVTYCSNLKCPASAALAKRLRALGYKNVIEYPHGIDGWAAAGNAVVTEK